MGIEELINKYLDFLVSDKKSSKYTLKDYRYYLNFFKDSFETDDPALLKDPNLIIKFRKKTKQFKKSTQNYFLIALRSFFIYLNSIGIKTLDPEGIDLNDNGPQTTQVLDPESIKKLLSAPDKNTLEGLRDISIIWLLATTGLKISKLAALNTDSVEKMELSPELLEHLKIYLEKRKDSYKPLFLRLKGAQNSENFGEKMRLSPRSIERMIEKYTKQVGLPVKATPQVLRHSFATELLISGEDLKTVQKKLEHKNLHTSKRYQQALLNLAKKSTP